MGAFKIGSVYRNEAGDVVRLDLIAHREHEEKWLNAFPFHGFAAAARVVDGSGMGYVSLVNGRYVEHMESAHYLLHLIPGELTQTPSGWVALGAEPKTPEQSFDDALARVRKVLFDQGNAAMIARDNTAAAHKYITARAERVAARPHWSAAFKSTAKPNPFQNYTAPDCSTVPDHLNASRHQMAAKQFHKA